MKFLLVSRHTGERDVPEDEKEANFSAWSVWLQSLNTDSALPVKGGKTVTSENVRDYDGEIEGALFFEAKNIEDAVEKAKKSPGLKYGWTHDVLEEMSM